MRPSSRASPGDGPGGGRRGRLLRRDPAAGFAAALLGEGFRGHLVWSGGWSSRPSLAPSCLHCRAPEARGAAAGCRFLRRVLVQGVPSRGNAGWTDPVFSKRWRRGIS